MTSVDAVVVGSGPNGLAAAITLAQAGRSVTVLERAATVGGGMRSAELEPGVIYDVCSAVHPLGVGSPFLSSLQLERHGIRWLQPRVPFTQPLDDGRVGVCFRDLEGTAEALGGKDGKRYRSLLRSSVDGWWELMADVLGPLVHIPRHPIRLARFGIPSLLPSDRLAALFSSDEARALLAGTAGHSIVPLNQPLTGSFSMLFLASAHAVGWPVVEGGSQQLAEAMARVLVDLGGTIHLEAGVDSWADLPPHRAVLFDTSPGTVLRVAGHRLSSRYRKRLERFRHGAGAFKVDYVLSGPVPWADPHSRDAGTVHVAGTFEELAAAEAQVAAGGHPDKPFVLVAQPSVVDPSRTPDDRHVLWAYTHVPAGSTVDMTAAIERQLERFAPGFSDLVMRRKTIGPADLAAYNENYVGGDIAGGSVDGFQAIRRPILSPHPYRTSDPRILLCSASTPPGGGVHGMAGHHGAMSALSGVLA